MYVLQGVLTISTLFFDRNFTSTFLAKLYFELFGQIFLRPFWPNFILSFLGKFYFELFAKFFFDLFAKLYFEFFSQLFLRPLSHILEKKIEVVKIRPEYRKSRTNACLNFGLMNKITAIDCITIVTYPTFILHVTCKLHVYWCKKTHIPSLYIYFLHIASPSGFT